MMKPRHVAGFSALMMLHASYNFYIQGHWAYIPPMISMALFCLFLLYVDFKREKKNGI